MIADEAERLEVKAIHWRNREGIVPVVFAQA